MPFASALKKRKKMSAEEKFSEEVEKAVGGEDIKKIVEAVPIYEKQEPKKPVKMEQYKKSGVTYDTYFESEEYQQQKKDLMKKRMKR